MIFSLLRVFSMLLIYQIKHFLCDFPLQTQWMLGKFKKGPAFILPLLAHSLIHGAFTYGIALLYKPERALYVAIADLVIHFIVDRIKASPSLGGRFKMLSSYECVSLVNSNIMPGTGAAASEADKKALLKSNKYFWWALGLDQMAHGITHILIVWALV